MRFLITALLVGGLLGQCLVLETPPALGQDLGQAVAESYPTNLALLTQVSQGAVSQMLMGFQAPASARVLVEAADRNEANWFIEDLILRRLSGWGYQPFLKSPSPVPESRTAKPGSSSSPSPPESPPVEKPSSLADAVGQSRADSTEAPGDAAADTSVTGNVTTAVDSTATAPPRPPALASPGPSSASDDGPSEDRPEYVLRFRVVQFDLSYPKSYRTSPFGSRKVQRRASVSLVSHLLQGGRQEVVWGGHGEVERIDVVPQNKLSLLEGTSFPFEEPTLNTKGWGALVEPALVIAIVAGLIYLFYTNQN
jgi:hypothetical protein